MRYLPSRAGNTFEQMPCRGKPNLPQGSTVYGIPHHSKQDWLVTSATCANPPAVGPSKWAKAKHAARLLISRINIRSGWGKCANVQVFCVTVRQTITHQARISTWLAAAHCALKCVPSLTVNVYQIASNVYRYLYVQKPNWLLLAIFHIVSVNWTRQITDHSWNLHYLASSAQVVGHRHSCLETFIIKN